MAKQYVLSPAHKTTCPNGCRSGVFLLSTVEILKRLPTFFICFECRFIGQVGVGPVAVLTLTDSEVS